MLANRFIVVLIVISVEQPSLNRCWSCGRSMAICSQLSRSLASQRSVSNTFFASGSRRNTFPIVIFPYRHLRAVAARSAYISSSQGIVDFLAVAPLWVALLGASGHRVLIILRVLRVLKLARYSSGVRSLL
jgi:hypothetical protein